MANAFEFNAWDAFKTLMPTYLRGLPSDAAAKLGGLGGNKRRFYKAGTNLGANKIMNRGYRRMGYIGGGVGAGIGGGAYLSHRRSSARDGLRARSSGGY